MKLGMIETLLSTCSEARIPLEYFFTSKRVILGFMMTYMHRKGLVIPYTVEQEKEAYEGAYIRMNPDVHEDAISYDAKAWYPSIARSANISPETKVLSATRPIGNFSKSVIPGVWYDNDKKGIVPEIMAVIVDGRDEFKRLQKKYSDPESKEFNKDLSEFYKRKQNAYKIFANSIYGLLGNPYFQFYDVHNAASITGIGNKGIQHVISYATKWIDMKLETNEEFKNEFGEYANVTIKGAPDQKYINSFDPDVQASLAPQKRLILAHTDSFFFTFADIYAPFKNRKRSREEYEATVKRFSDKSSKDYNEGIAKYFEGMDGRLWDTMTLTEFTLRFNYCIFDEVLSKITKKWSSDNNYKEDHLWFKFEKSSEVLVALSKAHYICYLQYDEGDLVMHLPFKKRVKAVGVELVKSDTPKWSKEKIYELLDDLFNIKEKKMISKKIGILRKDFMDPKNVHLISKPISINSLGPTASNTYPAPRLGALKWNYIVESDPKMS
jgi:DNA polymerase elongation subunit (family B)